MKKVIFILVSILLLTGCGNNNDLNNDKTNTNNGNLNCTRTYVEDGDNVTDVMVINYKNNIVTYVENTVTTKYSDTSYIDMVLGFGQMFATGLSEIDGFEMAYEKENDNTIKVITKVDYNKLDITKLKDTFGEDFDENSYYSNTNMSINEYKSNYLTEYSCK